MQGLFWIIKEFWKTVAKEDQIFDHALNTAHISYFLI